MKKITNSDIDSISGGGAYCGPQNNSVISSFIPDAPFGYDFGPSCQSHDACYSSGGSSKATCDDMFRDSMYEACGSSSFCKNVADVYYWAVDNFGDSSWAGDSPSNPQAGYSMRNPGGSDDLFR